MDNPQLLFGVALKSYITLQEMKKGIGFDKPFGRCFSSNVR